MWGGEQQTGEHASEDWNTFLGHRECVGGFEPTQLEAGVTAAGICFRKRASLEILEA